MRKRHIVGTSLLAAGASAALLLSGPSGILSAGASEPPPGTASQPAAVLVELRSVDAVDPVLSDFHLDRAHLRGLWQSPSFTGFAATVLLRDVDRLRHNPLVRAVSGDSIVHVAAAPAKSSSTSVPDWGLDRIDQRKLPLDHAYAPAGDGHGVLAYVIDTGIKTTHTDFEGRATIGVDLVGGGPIDDCNGHGTHVAGTIGGHKYGVAKHVSLVAVRVMDCNGSGPTSQIISGIDWVRKNHPAGTPAVANLSLGGARNTVLDDAIRALIASGVTVVVAAGNGDMYGQPQSACDISPARVKQAITVSAIDTADYRAPWAGYGSCVDLFAPGVDITSDWKSSDSATKTISGTSMAAPHAAGAAAVVLSLHPDYSPAQVSEQLTADATPSVVKASRTTRPRLLYVGGAAQTSAVRR